MNYFGADNVSLDGRSILITGGTGSFGNALTRTLFQRFKPARVVVFSRDEAKQYDMANAMGVESSWGRHLRFFIGDVRDRERLELAMRGIDTVIHAAAIKHVPAAEYNPFECIKTNVHGAENIVNAAFSSGVERVLALSTDKAVNPINLYGASKLAADKIFVAANNISGDRPTRFSVVRYGNVVGSRGSIVPLFNRLLSEGVEELPITDPRMARFFITLRQGVDFVISSLDMMTGGEIFVPKIPSLKITDLAEFMAPGMPQKVVGIRPGEKLNEVLISHDSAPSTLEFEDRFIVEPDLAFWKPGHHEMTGGQRVSPDFHYSSDNNTDWLDNDRLTQMLSEAAY
jgi:UDP-N-acetylglucosamine 4,6-dehydratase